MSVSSHLQSILVATNNPIIFPRPLNGEGNGNLLQYSRLENPMDGGAWWAAVHGIVKSLTWLSNFPFTFHFHALEKDMATHSSVLAWRIPGMVEPGGLPSLGLHRVRHDWSGLAAAAALCPSFIVESKLQNSNVSRVANPFFISLSGADCLIIFLHLERLSN